MEPVRYAVGDIHGRDDLLETLLDSLRDYHGLVHPSRSAEIVCLGDYIDGGPNSVAVLDRLMAGVTWARLVCLLGNHEAMLLECLETDDRQVWEVWLANGGATTVSDLGISVRFGSYDPKGLKEALGPRRVSWLRSLPHTHVSPSHLFVHAGIVPGIPLEAQQRKDLLWIRSRFLDSDVDHGRVVVHGHTPEDAPVVRHNRIGVDTGATSTGVLTAAVLAEDERPVFLRAVGLPV